MESSTQGPFRKHEEARGARFGELEGWSVALDYPAERRSAGSVPGSASASTPGSIAEQSVPASTPDSTAERRVPGSTPEAPADGTIHGVIAQGHGSDQAASAPGPGPARIGSRGLVAAREAAAIVDLTPLGRLKVTGKDRQGLLQRISMNDLRPLESGRFTPTIFGTAKGRIVDRALVLDRGDSFLILTAPAGRQRLQSWIRKYAMTEDVRVTDISSETAAFGLSGPLAPDLIRAACGIGTASLEAGRFLALPVDGVDAIIAPFDMLPAAWLVLADLPGIVSIYEQTLRAGEPNGAAPIGTLDAEILRIEAGIPADGHELTEDYNPWEARLEGSFSLAKGCYTGQEVMARLKTYDKLQKRLAGLRLGDADPGPVPERIRAIGEDGKEHEVGLLTSAARSERLGETIGLGFVRLAFEAQGTEVLVGEERRPASVASLPFAS